MKKEGSERSRAGEPLAANRARNARMGGGHRVRHPPDDRPHAIPGLLTTHPAAKRLTIHL